MRAKNYIVLFIIITLTIFVTGCTSGLVRDLEFRERKKVLGMEETRKEAAIPYSDQIVQQWSTSPHANPIEATIGRDGCISCHDGQAFTRQLKKADELTIATGQDCFTCHDGYGKDLKQMGIVDIPTKENSSSGLGSLCISCHNSTEKPNINDPNRSEPHYSSQGDVLTGSGGLKGDEELQFNNTFGHISLDDTCVDCHMPRLEEGFRDHSFIMKAENAELICGDCHDDVDDYNIPAKRDYDGNGKIEGMQDEIMGLMDILEEAINQALEGGFFETFRGSFVFYDREGKPLDHVSDEIYLAAYNYQLIKHDGSKGIHNPFFTVHLLQHSYKVLTGNEVEGASILH